jgi:hypothetical protein
MAEGSRTATATRPADPYGRSACHDRSGRFESRASCEPSEPSE